MGWRLPGKVDDPMFHGWQHLTAQDRENILRGIADGEVHGGPYHLEMDWVDKCNARCFFCNSEHIHHGESIPWDRARRLLDEARAGGLRSVRLSGGGEPTLHPQLPELFEYLGEHGIILDNLNTNGTQLTPRVLEGMACAHVEEVRISLNYCNEGDYERGMGLPGKFFGRAVEMTRALHAMRQGKNNFGQIQLQFFIHRPTARQIAHCYELGRELGADKIIFRELWGVAAEEFYQPQDLPEMEAQLREVLAADRNEGRVICQLESHGLGERVARLQQEQRAGEKVAAMAGAVVPDGVGPPPDERMRYCYIGWYSMTVMGNQSVYPCCFLISEKTLPPLDSLKEKSLSEVWRGEAYRRFRKEMRDYYLLQRPVPLFGQRVKRIAPQCASHSACPITRGMSDDEFYVTADEKLDKIRRQPLTQLWRQANRAGRFIQRKLRV